MKASLLNLILIISLIAVSCDFDPLFVDISCSDLEIGLHEFDDDQVEEALADLMKKTKPKPTDEDSLGHKENFQTIIESIEKSCDLFEVEMLCYACIETLPLQTEIRITMDSSGTEIARILDFSTPEGKKLEFLTMHE